MASTTAGWQLPVNLTPQTKVYLALVQWAYILAQLLVIFIRF
jgi:hypothetical protein